MPQLEVSALRQAVQENRYIITKHAQQRMGLRKVSHKDLKFIIATGDIIEEYPHDQPDPKALFMAFVKGEPVYLSCAFDGSYAHIITVHRYDPTRWVDPWTRK
ncbi:MAG: DUF4258 domain-containing protein [Acidobacteria bacterium]|nr:DUF4258 domain-containing protein [Acidobacteriota bacterium]